MPSSQDFNEQAFQSDVLQAVKELETIFPESPESGMVFPIFSALPIFGLTPLSIGLSKFLTLWRNEKGKKQTDQKSREELEKVAVEAQTMVQRKEIKKYLCPALLTVSSDSMDIAKVITPILTGASLAGTIQIPLTPILFGMIAIVIARSGIATICNEYKKVGK
jgi:hypothetical protein